MRDNWDILVVGDIILDKYIYGDITRISPEAPCPIFVANNKGNLQLGGASNVANQLSRMGYKTILSGTVADDNNGKIVMKLLEQSNINTSFISTRGNTTTLKTRYISGLHHQVFRIDLDQKNNTEENILIETIFIDEKIKPRCIVISDYDKGVVTQYTCQRLIKLGKELKIPTIVDIKVNDIDRYIGANIIKGNLREISALCGEPIDVSRHELCRASLLSLKEKLQCEIVIVTCGSEGIIAIDTTGQLRHVSSPIQQVYDVTGAGDVVTTYIAANLLENISMMDSLQIANKAAAISTTRFGTSIVSRTEVLNQDKQISVKDFNAIRSNKSVVFTNGCFDIIHAGHIDLLEKAKAMGDILVVGLNSDESISRLKGNSRPINNLPSRIKVLSAISDVDYIIVFDEDTPIDLIKAINPDILVKGNDYALEDIVGSKYVKSYGGKVQTISFTFNSSSTAIINKL